MSETIIVSLVSFAGTIVGSLIGILSANKLVNFRLQKLEEQVSKHNSIVERTYIIEGKVKEIENRLDKSN